MKLVFSKTTALGLFVFFGCLNFAVATPPSCYVSPSGPFWSKEQCEDAWQSAWDHCFQCCSNRANGNENIFITCFQNECAPPLAELTLACLNLP